MNVTPARLAELNRKIGTGPGGTDMTYIEEMQILRELQASRTTLEGVRADAARYRRLSERLTLFENMLRTLESEDFLQCERPNGSDPHCMCIPCEARAMLAPEKEPAQEPKT